MSAAERVVIYVGMDDDELDDVISATEAARRDVRCLQASSIPAVCRADVPPSAVLVVTRRARGDARLHLLSWQRWERPDVVLVLLNDGKRFIPLSSVVLGRGMGTLVPYDKLSGALMRQVLSGARQRLDVPTVPIMMPVSPRTTAVSS